MERANARPCATPLRRPVNEAGRGALDLFTITPEGKLVHCATTPRELRARSASGRGAIAEGRERIGRESGRR